MRTFFLILIYIPLVVLIIPLLLVCFILRATKPLYVYVRAAIGLAPRILGIRVIVSGREHVDRKKAYVFMANHLSFLDGPLLLWLIPHPVRVIFKKQLTRIPVIGQGMLFVRFIPVDRKGTEGGKAAIQRAVRMMKEEGFSFLIFPEGTRTRTGRMQAFRRGGFYLALESGTAILPVTITGTFGLMPKGKFWIRRGEIRVTYHPAVSVEGYDVDSMSALMDKVRAVIAAGLSPEEEPESGNPVKEFDL